MTACPKPRQSPRKPRKYIKTVNPTRAKKRRARDFGSIAEWIVTLPCCCDTLGHVGVVQPAHVKSRGAGGRARGNLLPMCAVHHEMQHRIGWAGMRERHFIAKDAYTLAAEYQELYDQTFSHP